MNSWDSKLVIVLPALNESENLQILLKKIRTVVRNARIIIIDDSNPPEDIKKITSSYNNIEVIIRKNKLGRGSAVLHGFKRALKNKSLTYFIEMDTDLSHDPKHIPFLRQALVKNKADLVIGSRYLAKSKIVKWPIYRIILSKIINFNLSIWLAISLHDFTNGYRLYTRDAVHELVTVGIQEKGFIALSESVYILNKKGYKIIETPITFIDRIHGNSTVGIKELYTSLFGVFRIKMRKIHGKRKSSKRVNKIFVTIGKYANLPKVLANLFL